MRGPHSGISPLLRWHSFGMPCQSRSSIPSISAIVAPKFKNLQPNCHISTSQALEKDSKKVSHEHALFQKEFCRKFHSNFKVHDTRGGQDAESDMVQMESGCH